MKKLKTIISSLIILSCTFIFSGCGENYIGVWYGLDEGSLYYGNEDNESIPKLVLKKDGTFSCDMYNGGTYYISDEILFLENENDFLRELSISNRSDAAEKLNFQDSGSGTVFISIENNDGGSYTTLYYPSKELWQEAWKKLETQRIEQLKETLCSSVWFSVNEDLSDKYVNLMCDVYKFDGSTVELRIGSFDENDDFHYSSNEEFEELKRSWTYDVTGAHTITFTNNETGEVEELSCNKFLDSVLNEDFEYLQLSSEKDGYFELAKVSDYRIWKINHN